MGRRKTDENRLRKGVWRALCLLFVTVVMSGAVRTAQAAEVRYYGDANLNGEVDAEDALFVLKHVVRLEEMEKGSLSWTLADMDADGVITANDALEILKTVVKLEDRRVYTEPIEEPTAEPTAAPTEEPTPTPTKTPVAEWPLWNDVEEMPYYNALIDQDIPKLYEFLAEDNTTGACVIICPGGGYATENTQATANFDVARELNDSGISAFVLQYRTAPYTYKAIISDVLRAVRFVRYHSESFGVDPGKVTIMGFSAGGHLALMCMEHYADEDIELTGDAIDALSAKPDSGVLGYPVVSMLEEYGHQTSRDNFLGAEADNEELRARYSGELGVTEDTPPMFIWHCKPDRAVSYLSSVMLAETLEEHGVPCELQIFETGSHGPALGSGDAGMWIYDGIDWILSVNGDL